MKIKLSVNRKFTKAQIDDRIFSGFVEHLGRAVYTGIYEPEHPTADENGFRGDVAGLVRDLNMPLTRYPGGNFVSGYDWKDSIGPKAQRPLKADYAWEGLEPNQVGIDEFVKWCKKAGTAPLMTVNLGTGSPKSAMELIEYCNSDNGTFWSELRKKNGAEKPYGIKVWCLGNEMDGEWQIGHKTATEYGRIAAETGRMLKMVDKNIELVVCGSSAYTMGTFGTWDAEVLKECYDTADYISLHAYYNNAAKNIPDFLASPEKMDRQIESIVSICDYVQACRKSPKKMNLSFDEWNVWYHSMNQKNEDNKWTVARPILEDIYDMADVLVVGGLLMSLMDHADRVKIACIAQTVNVIAPIMTRPGGGCWKQSIYYPLYYTSRYGRGTILELCSDSQEYACDGLSVRYLRATAVLSSDGKELVIFALNRSGEEKAELECTIENFAVQGITEAIEITADSLNSVNTETEENVKPLPCTAGQITLTGNTLQAELKPYSWNCIRLSLC